MRLMAVFGALLACGAAFVPNANAVELNISGWDFHGSGLEYDSVFLDASCCLVHTGTGTVYWLATAGAPCNPSNGRLDIVAPINQTGQKVENQTIYMNGSCGGTISCWIVSYDRYGTVVGSTAVDLTGSHFSVKATMTPAQLSDWGTEVAFCSMPSGSSCNLLGFKVVP